MKLEISFALRRVLPALAIPLIWSASALVYLGKTPYDVRSHDAAPHVYYTLFIRQHHRLPNPQSGWETYQPPLYYLLNSVMPGPPADHIRRVRYLSVLLGALSLLMMWAALGEKRISRATRVAVLAFVASIPKYYFVFTTYNNDALAVPLAMLTILCAYVTVRTSHLKWAAIMALVGVAAIHTKYDAAVPIALVSGAAVWLWRRGDVSARQCCLVVGASGIALLSILPYFYWHNYLRAHELVVTNFNWSDRILGRASWENLLRVSFGRPYWKTPFTLYTNNFWLYSFISTVFGESDLSKEMTVFLCWVLIALHLLIKILALIWSRRERFTSLVAAIIIAAFFAPIPLMILHPQFRLADYRYLAWGWMLWALLLGSWLEVAGRLKWPRLIPVAAATAIQVFGWARLSF